MYPQDKETAGRSWWTVIHNLAAEYPDFPNPTEKIKAKRTFNYLIDKFVCKDCVNHAKDYIKQNGEPDFSSRTTLSNYFCNMHNAVNERLGKPKVDCSSIITETVATHDNSTCTTCTVKNKSTLETNLEDYKKTVRDLILNTCKEEKISPPNIHFQPCPDNTSTSCIIYDQTRMKDGVHFGDADIYINPYSASLRTIFHETKHWADLKKGIALSEVPTDNYAIDKINKHFQFDSYKSQVQQNDNTTTAMMDEQVLVAKDNNDNTIKLLPTQNDVFTLKKKDIKYDQLNLKTYHDYPSLSRINNLFENGPGRPPTSSSSSSLAAGIGGGAEQVEQEALPAEHKRNIFVPENNDDFILSGLNGIFAWPASLVGVPPSTMSMQYVGSLVTNVAMYIISSNFSTFGSSMVSTLSAVTLFTGSAIFKNSIGQGDRGFIQGIIGMLLSHGINSLTPQKRAVMSEGLRLFIEGIKTFDLSKVKEALFFDDEAFTINKNIIATAATKPQQKGLSDNERVANALMGSSADVGGTRNRQLASRSDYDIAHFVTNPLGGNDKNTIPNYSNSDLRSVASAYERRRQILNNAGGGPSLSGISDLDVDTLSNEINNGLADMELDSNAYEILNM